MKQILLPALVLIGLLTGCLPARRDVTAADQDVVAEDDAVDPGSDVSGATGDVKGDAKDTAGDTETDVPKLGCAFDSDCTGFSDACRTGSCDLATGLCKVTPAADDSPCAGVDDKCALSATCKSGLCVKVPQSCDDGNPCTVDSCDPLKGCSGSDVPAPKICGPKKDQACGCDDGDACTVGDVCTGTSCKGSKVTCDDKNACTTDACDQTDGCVFSNKPENSVCDDGNAHCTTGDKCVGGVCNGTAVKCPADSNKCNIVACIDFLGGCQTAAFDGAPCNDGDPCTDKDACNSLDPQNGACTGVAKNCDDKNECTDDACVPGSGCSNTPNSATTCKAGGVCAAIGTCNAGVCQAPSNACDDGNVCTDDACDAVKGCTHTNNTAPCNDGNACTYAEACTVGVCGNGNDVSADDGNDCTADACDPATGPNWTIKGNGVGCGANPNATKCTGGICLPATACNDGICGASETAISCLADCPLSGGPCNTTDSACIATCAGKTCSDAITACESGDDGCAAIKSCADACGDAACILGCLLPTTQPGYLTSLQLWLNIQWCQGAQCVGNGWSGKPCVPGTGEYAACAAGCESAMCLQTALGCETTNGCPAQRTCLAACNANAACEANCLADPAATTAAKALLSCTMQRCQ